VRPLRDAAHPWGARRTVPSVTPSRCDGRCRSSPPGAVAAVSLVGGVVRLPPGAPTLTGLASPVADRTSDPSRRRPRASRVPGRWHVTRSSASSRSTLSGRTVRGVGPGTVLHLVAGSCTGSRAVRSGLAVASRPARPTLRLLSTACPAVRANSQPVHTSSRARAQAAHRDVREGARERCARAHLAVGVWRPGARRERAGSPIARRGHGPDRSRQTAQLPSAQAASCTCSSRPAAGAVSSVWPPPTVVSDERAPHASRSAPSSTSVGCAPDTP
jgi:hypothetical protein